MQLPGNTTTAKKYVAATGAGETACLAGGYCAGGTTVYAGGTVSGRNTTGGMSVCATDKYSNASAASCTACSTSTGYHNSGSSVSDHAGVKSCVANCGAGTYVSTSAGACGNVGAGYYMPAHTVKQTETDNRGQCPVGQTTIGYGTGADGAGDCGRIFHASDGTLYLRSTKRTTPSLNVKIGNTTYYGNMSTVERNMSTGTSRKMKFKSGGTTYYMYDDSIGGESEIPSGYTQVDYIEGTGTQWINTGIYLTDEHVIEFKAQNVGDFIGTRNPSDSGSSASFGVTTGSTLDMYSSTNYINSGGRLTVSGTNSTTNYVYHVGNGNKYLADTNGNILGSNNYTVAEAFTSVYPCPVFKISWGSENSHSPSRGKLYYLKMWENAVLVRDFIPVMRNSDSKCGLYDTVSGTFFDSATSTAFVCPN